MSSLPCVSFAEHLANACRQNHEAELLAHARVKQVIPDQAILRAINENASWAETAEARMTDATQVCDDITEAESESNILKTGDGRYLLASEFPFALPRTADLSKLYYTRLLALSPVELELLHVQWEWHTRTAITKQADACRKAQRAIDTMLSLGEDIRQGKSIACSDPNGRPMSINDKLTELVAPAARKAVSEYSCDFLDVCLHNTRAIKAARSAKSPQVAEAGWKSSKNFLESLRNLYPSTDPNRQS